MPPVTSVTSVGSLTSVTSVTDPNTSIPPEPRGGAEQPLVTNEAKFRGFSRETN
jgi:hypothetical protein